jgi:hypothetical protein
VAADPEIALTIVIFLSRVYGVSASAQHSCAKPLLAFQTLIVEITQDKQTQQRCVRRTQNINRVKSWLGYRV